MLQQIMFPDGIKYDWKNEQFQTTGINSVFLPIPYLLRDSGAQKKRINGNSVHQSAQVTLTRKISNFLKQDIELIEKYKLLF